MTSEDKSVDILVSRFEFERYHTGGKRSKGSGTQQHERPGPCSVDPQRLLPLQIPTAVLALRSIPLSRFLLRLIFAASHVLESH